MLIAPPADARAQRAPAGAGRADRRALELRSYPAQWASHGYRCSGASSRSTRGCSLVGTLVLVLRPGGSTRSIAVVETLDLVVVSAGDARRQPAAASADALAPVDRLVERMRHGRPAPAGPAAGRAGRRPRSCEVVRAFNEMLDRLETERRESSRRALAAQEAERLRIARSLHDEVGQVADRRPAPARRARRGGAREPTRRSSTRRARRSARSLEEVRRIAQELRPELLEHLGLRQRADASCARTFGRQSGMRVERQLAARPAARSTRRPSSRLPRRPGEPHERRPPRRRRARVELAARARSRQRRPAGGRRRPRDDRGGVARTGAAASAACASAPLLVGGALADQARRRRRRRGAARSSRRGRA